ncbi:hypothetical protein [Fulvimarina sp. MAC8]|uniref:hypothetical protein n=1 Tax=Fulvimarina sp. MAC8 TaxID=3162874 RepID=UPI0032F0830A
MDALDTMTLLRQNGFVGGEWIGSDAGETIDVANPATGETLGTVLARNADGPASLIGEPRHVPVCGLNA